MKIKNIMITGLVAAGMILYGCVETNTPATPSNTVKSTTSQAVEKTTTTQASDEKQNGVSAADLSLSQEILKAPGAITQQTENSDPSYLANQTAYNAAVKMNDPSLCQKITNEDLKKQCVTGINDVKITTEALAKGDKSLCAKLSAEALKLDCEMKIEMKKVEQTKIDQYAQQTTADENLRDQIIASGDYSRCKELKVYGHQVDCESNILTPLALEKKDKSICSKATIDVAKQNCEIVYDKSSGA